MKFKTCIASLVVAAAFVSGSSYALPPGNPVPFSPLAGANTVHGVPYRWAEDPFIHILPASVHVVSLTGLQDGYLLDCSNGNYALLKAIARHTIHAWNQKIVYTQCNAIGPNSTPTSDGTFWLISTNLGGNFNQNNAIGKLLRNGYIRQIVEVPVWNRNLQTLNSQRIVAWHLVRP